jgi:restriction system protein
MHDRGTGLTVDVRGHVRPPHEVMTMSRSRIASVEFAELRKEQERAAAEARRLERAARKLRDERATQQYFADRAAEAQRLSRQLDTRVAELGAILEHGLRRNPRIDLDRLREQYVQPAPDLGSVGWPATPPDWSRYEPPPPSVLGRVVGGRQHQQQLAAARAAYERARADYERAEAERQRRFADARRRYAARIAEERLRVDEHNRSVDAFVAALRRREPDAVSGYLGMVLDAVPVPDTFPAGARVRWPVARFELPDRSVVPAVAAVRYDRAADELREVPRPAGAVDALYRQVVAQVALLCLRDLFAADPGLELISFHGLVRGVELVGVTTGRGPVERVLARELPAPAALSALDGEAELRWAS